MVRRKALSFAVLVAVFSLVSAVFFLERDWSIRFRFPVTIISSHEFSAPGFSFRYPDGFEMENDTSRYGERYVSGFHAQGDVRTGCDVRLSDAGINFAKDDGDIRQALAGELSKDAEGFSLERGYRMMLGTSPGFSMEFSFLDPAGNTMRVRQVMATHGAEQYILICGSSAASWKFFEEDFAFFFEHFRFR